LLDTLVDHITYLLTYRYIDTRYNQQALVSPCRQRWQRVVIVRQSKTEWTEPR